MNIKKKIAVLAPPVLPVSYDVSHGGIELMAYYQCEELVERGYEVTLFASAGSKTSAKLEITSNSSVSQYKIDLSTMESSRKLRLESVLVGETFRKLINNNYDLIFNHLRGAESNLLFSQFIDTPIATILHLPLFEEMATYFENIKAPLISISLNQRKYYPNLNYVGNVYNGIDVDKFVFNDNPDDYFLNVTTIGRHKNQLPAILAAKKMGKKLILTGKIRDQEYFDNELKPKIDGKQIIYKGQMNFEEKVSLYNHAAAFIFPIHWQEPFGLVMIEAMACGTPIVAFNHGAVSEVVEDNKTGFIVNEELGVDGLVSALNKIHTINRTDCRMRVKNNFTKEKMADGYEKIIQKLS